MTEGLKPLKWYKGLAAARGRLQAGAFLVEGPRAVSQIAAANPSSIEEIVAVEGTGGHPAGYPVRLVSESQFRSISNTDTPQGILAVVRSPYEIYSAQLPDAPGPRILLLEDIQDPGNAGTLIRTAAAFDYSGIIMSNRCADPLSPKCVQSSAGAVLSLWIRRTEEYLTLARRILESGYTLVAADLEGDEDMSPLGRRPLVVALGNEASGLSQTLRRMASCRLRVPVASDKAQSLNVAACGAICMYESIRRGRG